MATVAQTTTTATMSSFLKDRSAAVPMTQMEDIPKIVSQLRSFYDSGATRSLSFRKEQLRKLYYLVEDHMEEFVQALYDDIRKPRQEALAGECQMTLQDIINVVKNIDTWAKDEYVPVNMTFKFSKCRIRKEPLGVVLVMGPWNYPVWCTLCPALNAIAAGNAPSEHAPATSALLAKLVPEYFSSDFFAVVTGTIPVATALLAEKFDHIIYTGGSYAAKFVAAAAAKTLTPVTLELGGKNPCVIDTTVDDNKLEMFATRIMWGKFSNTGQICLGSDHVIIVGPPEREEAFIALAKKAANNFSRGGNMSKIVNEAHFDRLEGLLKGTKGQVVHGGDLDRQNSMIGITIIKGVQSDDSLMSDEIFGPLLAIMRVDTLDEAIKLIKKTEIPLALYVFSENRRFINTLLDRCPSGGVSINDTLMHAAVPNLPFGGVGPSGLGSYRSKYGFFNLSNLRGVAETPTWKFFEKLLEARYPPYTPERLKKMQKLIGVMKPPFTHTEGSADHSNGVTGWVYAAGVAAVAGIAGVIYRREQGGRLN